jgi:transposase
MRKQRTLYPAEFRAQMVELVKAGRTPEELSREFGPTVQTIINWVAQADRDAGVRQDDEARQFRESIRRDAFVRVPDMRIAEAV